MNLLKLMSRLFFMLALTLTLIACNKPDEPDTSAPLAQNYIRSGNDFYPITSALAIYDNSFAGKTFFTLDFRGENENVAFFDFLQVVQTTTLPDGTFAFYKPADVAQFQNNKFHSIYLNYGNDTKTVIDSRVNTIQAGSVHIQKINSEYQIRGRVIKDGKQIEIVYKGVVDHNEAW